MSSAPPLTKFEITCLLVVLLVGGVLRFSQFDLLAVEHFDEAVYASNLLFPREAGGQYPHREFFAPYLVPSTIEWLTILLGAWGGLTAFLPALAAGWLMIPSVWWFGRRWFGPVAGLTGAGFCATSGFQIAYSRTALTDVPLALFVLWAVYWSIQAVEGIGASPDEAPRKSPPAPASGHSWRPAMLAGLFTGLAWSTKYNGWLPLAIFGAAMVAHLVNSFWWHRRDPAHHPSPVSWGAIRPLGQTFAVMALVAVVVWLPAWWDLQDVGGYAAVAANHSGYVQGWTFWGTNWLRQIGNLATYSNWVTTIGGTVTVACGVFAALSGGSQMLRAGPRTLATIWAVIGLNWICLRYAIESAYGILTLFSVCVASWLPRGERGRIASLFLGVWLVGLFVATPLYTPYPRLLHVLLPVLWLGMGVVVERYCHHLSLQGNENSVAPRAESGKSNWRLPLRENLFMVPVLLMALPLGDAWSDFWMFVLLSFCAWDGMRAALLQYESPPAEEVDGTTPLGKALVRSFLPINVISILSILSVMGYMAWNQPSLLRWPTWESRIALRDATRRLTDHVADPANAIVYVHSEPASWYHLRTEGRVAAGIVGDYSFHDRPSQGPVYLLQGFHVERSAEAEQAWQALAQDYELIAEETFTPSSIVLLDNFSPDELQEQPSRGEQTLRLYRRR